MNSFNKTSKYYINSSLPRMHKKENANKPNNKSTVICFTYQIYLLWEVGFCSSAYYKSQTGIGPSSPEKKDRQGTVPKCMQESNQGKLKKYTSYCFSYACLKHLLKQPHVICISTRQSKFLFISSLKVSFQIRPISTYLNKVNPSPILKEKKPQIITHFKM